VPLAALEAQGLLSVEGDRALAERFVTLFPLPPKVQQEVPAPPDRPKEGRSRAPASKGRRGPRRTRR
jgi:hypothetical protein